MFNNLKAKLESAHPGFAYELLQLQMSIEDEKLKLQPNISQITKLLQLYMKTGVQVLESISDKRFMYFNNKIQSLMMKRHVVKKLHECTGKSSKDISFTSVKKQQLQEKKNQYDLHCYYNKDRIDMKVVKEIISTAEKRDQATRSKLTEDIRRQEDRLQSRIKQRKMRSESGSVHKMKIGSQINGYERQLRDSRLEYFDEEIPKKQSRKGSTGKNGMNLNGQRKGQR